MLTFYDNVVDIYTMANIHNICRKVRSVTFVETAKNSDVFYFKPECTF